MKQKSFKQTMLIVAFGAALFAVLTDPVPFLSFTGEIISVFSPVIAGLILGFVLNVPMKTFERLLGIITRKRPMTPKVQTGISLACTLLCILLVLFLIITLVVPEAVSSVKNISGIVEDNLPEWMELLNEYGIDLSRLKELLSSYELDLQHLASQLSSGVGTALTILIGMASSTVTSLTRAGIALVIAIYILLGKKDLLRQGRRFAYAYLKKSVADRLCHICSLLNDTYARFFSGQCVEAVILGGLMAIAFRVFHLPYAGLVGILTAACSFVPYIGAFVSATVVVLLTLLTDYAKAPICIFVYVAVQFVENQFIYPHVVGSSVGLPALLTLIAVLIGGKLFGIVGMIFFIPLAAVLYALLREDVADRLRKRQIEIA